MHAARLELDAQAVSERGGKCTRERCPTGRVKSAHSPQMSCEVTVGHKSRDDRLIEPGISRMQSAARMGEAFDKLLKDDQVAETQGGKQDFAEAAGIKHDVGLVEAL